MSEVYTKALKRCVASWRLLKSEAKTRRIDVLKLLEEWSISEDRLREEEKIVKPYEFQEKFYEKLKRLAEKGGLLVVQAPTASGKTEAVAATFLSQWVEEDWWLAPRLIYTLPTRALTLTSFARLSSYSRGIASMLNVAPLPVSFEYGSTFAPKHYLYGGPIVASTLDAVAYGYVAQRVPGKFYNPRLSLPVSLLATSLFVLDEAQLYQDKHYYSPAVIGTMLKPLILAGAVVVVMSATLPSLLLKELANGVDYEYLDSEPVGRGEVEIDVTNLLSKKKLPDALGDKEVSSLIKEELDSGSVLIVVNTVERAAMCYRLLRESYPNKVVLLHGKMANIDRIVREKRLFSENLVVISTQVVEAGFDFDAKLMITELAPLDSLIQRAGRVARSRGAKGRVLVFDVADPEPYASEFIEETRRLLLETSGDALKTSLYNVKKAQDYLNEVYTEPWVSLLKEKVTRDLLETEAYFRALRLFSFPPEEDFKLRRGFYVTLIVPEVYEQLLQQYILSQDVSSKLFKLLQCFKSPNKPVPVELNHEELQQLIQLLEKSSISVGFEELPHNIEDQQSKKTGKRKRKKTKKEALIAARLSIRKISKEARTYEVVCRPYKRKHRVAPLKIYVLNAGIYSKEEGLVT
ncbi:MAG: CRISPR-associated helicase Cas3' [Thermofilum sp.]|jgi:CRISPR-associated endonuclease/helicase Cas3|nr:CRISPR-associated helicase Cas3' [Thermofilum sp.]